MKFLYAPLLAFMLLPGCTLLQDSTSDVQLNDPATQVKTHLINQAALDAAAVQVEQVGDAIHLRGFAESEIKKQRLEALARDAAGGMRIVNEIIVR